MMETDTSVGSGSMGMRDADRRADMGRAPDVACAEEPAPGPDAGADDSSAGAMNIVLVGDESGCARHVWINLKPLRKDFGLNCYWVDNADQVRELAGDVRIDVILHDVSPDATRLEHLDELRRAGNGATIIVLTEDDRQDTLRQLRALGVEDHIGWHNIRVATLRRVVGRVIERRRFQLQIDSSLRRERLRGKVLARIAEGAPLPEVLADLSEGLRRDASCADFGFAIDADEASGGLLLWPNAGCISAQLASRALSFAHTHRRARSSRSEGPGHVEPILNGDKLIGELVVLPSPGTVVGESLRAHARLATELVALAVDRLQTAESLRLSQEELRHLSAQLLNIQEAERQRIACDLHDVIGQSLSVVKVAIEEAQQQFMRDGLPDAAAVLNRLVPWVKQALAEVRRVSMDLRPAIIDDLGLLPTLSWFFRELGASCRTIVVEPKVTIEESDIPAPLKIAVFRILQEAVTNTIKHAHATRIQVVLQRFGSVVQLAVIDNGTGFDTHAPGNTKDWKSGLGLASMRERARVSGGNYVLESTPGIGTSVFVSWYRD
jgi:signal transduction histidine kinase